MKNLLYITAPAIYILIILFSSWIGIRNSRQSRRGINVQPIIAILAGLSTCPLIAVLVQLGRLDIPAVEIRLPLICISLGVGFFVGFIYIWLAVVVLDNTALASLYVLGTIGGSAICLYFYFFYNQVQEDELAHHGDFYSEFLYIRL